MLILSRKTDQKILIGENIVVAVLEIRRDHVKVGIDAPQQLRVYRHEVYESIQAENKIAALSEIDAIEDVSDSYLPDPQEHR